MGQGAWHWLSGLYLKPPTVTGTNAATFQGKIEIQQVVEMYGLLALWIKLGKNYYDIVVMIVVQCAQLIGP